MRPTLHWIRCETLTLCQLQDEICAYDQAKVPVFATGIHADVLFSCWTTTLFGREILFSCGTTVLFRQRNLVTDLHRTASARGILPADNASSSPSPCKSALQHCRPMVRNLQTCPVRSKFPQSTSLRCPKCRSNLPGYCAVVVPYPHSPYDWMSNSSANLIYANQLRGYVILIFLVILLYYNYIC